MKLTDRTDYAFRVLMYLAVNGGRLATVGEIAARYGISHSHLTRVVWALGRTGFVETVRGKGGGLRLARPAEAVGVGAVARSMERGGPARRVLSGRSRRLPDRDVLRPQGRSRRGGGGVLRCPRPLQR